MQNIWHECLFIAYLMSVLEFCNSHYFLETLIIFTCVRIQVDIQRGLHFLYIKQKIHSGY
jgi:hypothetical protein